MSVTAQPAFPRSAAADLRRLEDRSLIVQHPDLQDRRRRTVRHTSEGTSLVAAISLAPIPGAREIGINVQLASLGMTSVSDRIIVVRQRRNGFFSRGAGGPEPPRPPRPRTP